MTDKTFSELEHLNAIIDVLIDNKKCAEIENYLRLSKGAKSFIRRLFENHNCTFNKDSLWIKALKFETPFESVVLPGSGVSHKPSDKWTQLYWAKLLRARIQSKGTDCYFQRLDDVINFLENNLPHADSKDYYTTKLKMIFLLELSTSALGAEQLGFAERARQLMRYHPKMIEDKSYNFYDLWARYNIGVAHFHQSQYRAAILEFNKIIYQEKRLRSERNQKKELDFFERNEGYRLLLSPAIMFRAEVQLKLQLAYHALDTLYNLLYSHPILKEFMDSDNYMWIQAELIEIQAYQQMGRLVKSWEHIESVCDRFSDNPIDERYKCNFPIFEDLQRGFEERFLDILIDDHLNSLDLYGRVYPHFPTYLLKLNNAFSETYFKLVRYNQKNRQGYYQQLARYLSWIVQKQKSYKDKALKLYDKRKEGIEEREGTKLEATDCPFCKPEGIDLQRLEEYHYDSFAENMQNFYDSFDSERDGKIQKIFKKNKAKLICRLIELERTSREDLRIRDLNLRYKLHDVRSKLKNNYDDKALCKITGTAFGGFLSCAKGDYIVRGRDPLLKEDYEHIIGQWKDSFLRQLKLRSTHEQQVNGTFFLGLQRWNSSSPAKGRSSGGGYLLYHTGKNGDVDMAIAIDPGFDFLHNLFHCGFSLYDIDIVLISHAHEDHIHDLESIVLLLLERSKKGLKKRRIHAILTLGVYRRLEHIFTNRTLREFIEPYVIDINKEIDRKYWDHLGKEPSFRFVRVEEDDGGYKGKQYTDYEAVNPGANAKEQWDNGGTMYPKVEIKPTQAYHDDFSGYSDSFGFKIEVTTAEEQNEKVRFGYTGDTKWVYPEIYDPIKTTKRNEKRIIKDIAHQYADCDTVVVHLGSLVDMDHESDPPTFDQYKKTCKARMHDKCEKQVRKRNHPYLVGMLRLLATMRSNQNEARDQSIKLILLGEFGEELRGGIRIDLSDRFTRNYKKDGGDGLVDAKMMVFPVDVGITIRLLQKGESRFSPKAWCVQCEKFIDVSQANFQHYGTDEALFCVCRTCIKATPLNVLQDRFRRLYEVGRELKTRDGAQP